MTDREIPQDIKAEQSVLGAILIDGESIDRLAPFLQAGDFFREAHQHIYTAAMRLHARNEKCDFVTLSSELKAMNLLEAVGGESYVASLVGIEITSVHAEYYGKAVLRASVRRKMINTATLIEAIAYDGSLETVDAMSQVQRAAMALAGYDAEMKSVKAIDAATDFYDDLVAVQSGKDPKSSLKYGYVHLDNVTGGMHRSELILLAGRPSTGKTTLALNIAAKTAALSKPVAIFSMESTAKEIAKRFLSLLSKVAFGGTNVLTDEESERIAYAMGTLSELPIIIEEQPLDMAALYARAKLAHAQHDTQLIIIDYLGLIKGHSKNGNRNQEISEISRMLKSLARELNVPVIALSQLNRASETRDGHAPMLSDLRDSGSLEQDADVVMFLQSEKDNRDAVKDVDLIVAKNRNGPTNSLKLKFHASEFRFENALTMVTGEERYA